MATRKYRVSMHSITRAIEKVEKRLHEIQPKVSPEDQKKIKLELESLKECFNSLTVYCKPGAPTPIRPPSHQQIFNPLLRSK